MAKLWGPLVLLGAVGVLAAFERFGRRSGATVAEARMQLPGDQIVRRPMWRSTRAISIAAGPDQVWPWIVQMGFPPHRAGWYTPHWMDVAMWGDRPRSADRIVPELQTLGVGDTIPDSADYSIYYDVEAVVPPPPGAESSAPDVGPAAHLLLHSVRHVFGPIKESNFTWAFVLRPDGRGGTRLIVRARVSYRPLWAIPLIELMLNAGDLVNVTFMLRNIRRLAERTAGPARPNKSSVGHRPSTTHHCR